MQQQYCIRDTPLLIAWEHARVGPVVEQVFAYFGLRHDSSLSSGGAPLSVSIAVSGAAFPEAPRTRKVVRFDNGIVVWQHEGGVYLTDGDCFMHAARGSGTASILLAPRLFGNAPEFGRRLFNLLMMSILILLRRRALFPMHAAALARAGKGVLVVGNSDCGKSTLSYNLVRAGWDFLSDDAILLSAGPSGVEAVPFRRNFGLDRDAEALFPEIAGNWASQFADFQKRSIPMDALYPAQASGSCVPEVLVFPQIADTPQTRLVPLGPAEAMRRVMEQSAFLELEPPLARAHLDALRALVGQTLHYRLFAGRDIKSDSALAARFMEALIPA